MGLRIESTHSPLTANTQFPALNCSSHHRFVCEKQRLIDRRVSKKLSRAFTVTGARTLHVSLYDTVSRNISWSYVCGCKYVMIHFDRKCQNTYISTRRTLLRIIISDLSNLLSLNMLKEGLAYHLPFVMDNIAALARFVEGGGATGVGRAAQSHRTSMGLYCFCGEVENESFKITAHH